MTAGQRPPNPPSVSASQLAADRAALGLGRAAERPAPADRGPDLTTDTDALRRLIAEMRRVEAADTGLRRDVQIGEFIVEGTRVPLSLVVPLQALTRMEAAVLRFLGWGRSNADIATLLNVNESTIRSHLNNAVQRLGIDGVRQLNCVAGLLFHPID